LVKGCSRRDRHSGKGAKRSSKRGKGHQNDHKTTKLASERDLRTLGQITCGALVRSKESSSKPLERRSNSRRPKEKGKGGDINIIKTGSFSRLQLKKSRNYLLGTPENHVHQPWLHCDEKRSINPHYIGVRRAKWTIRFDVPGHHEK